MILKIVNYFVVFLFVISAQSLAAPGAEVVSKKSDQAIIKKGLALMYNLDYEQAETQFQILIKKDLKNPAGYVFLALNDIFKLVVEGESPELINRIDKEIKLANHVAELAIINPNSTWDNYFAANAFLLNACWQGREKKYLRSMQAIKRGMQELEIARTNQLTHADSLALLGTYQYFMANTPWTVNFFASIMVQASDRRMGIRNLEVAFEQSQYNISTAELILSIIYVWEGEPNRAATMINRLQAKYPDNILFYNLKKNMFLEQGKVESAIEVMHRTLAVIKNKKSLSGLSADVNYDLAQLYEKQKNVAKADYYYTQSYNVAKSKPAIKAWSALHLGIIREKQKKESEARQWYRNASLLSEDCDLVNACAKLYLREGYKGELPE